MSLLCVSVYKCNVLIMFNMIKLLIKQVQLKMFRAQWMSELKPGSGGSGTSDRLVRSRGLKRPDTANEEKVRSNGSVISDNALAAYISYLKVFNISSGCRALLKSSKGRAERSFL